MWCYGFKLGGTTASSQKNPISDVPTHKYGDMKPTHLRQASSLFAFQIVSLLRMRVCVRAKSLTENALQGCIEGPFLKLEVYIGKNGRMLVNWTR